MIITEPGLYTPDQVSNEDYHRSEGISNSNVRDLLDCPKLYWYKRQQREYEQEHKTHFSLGSALHTLVLEPDTFFDRYLIVDAMPTKPNRRSTYETCRKYEDFIASAGGKEILTTEQYDQVNKMAESIRNHAMYKAMMTGRQSEACIEHSIAWEDMISGALMRTRPDYYNNDFILDIKTTRDVRSEAFQRSIDEYGYHSQGAMACNGLTKITERLYDTVILFTVSTKPPYLVKAYMLSDEALEIGKREYQKAGIIYQQCKNVNWWPGYEEKITEISLPQWSIKRKEIHL